MKQARAIIITKCDGTLEPFAPAKLRNCLARVMRFSGNPRMAEPLARAIGLHLLEDTPDVMPSSEYVYRCVRSVLRQTGLADAAEVLARHRAARLAQRRRVRVYDADRPDTAPVRWRKADVTSKLESLYGLRHATARFLAGRIEERVLALGYGLISRGFLLEMLRNEVLAWGLLFERVPADATVGEPPAVETPLDQNTNSRRRNEP